MSVRYSETELLIESYYGKSLKAVVAFIVEADPYLEIESVKTDTDSTYYVYLRVKGSDVGFEIYNSSSSWYFGYGYYVDGAYTRGSYNQMSVSSNCNAHVVSCGISDGLICFMVSTASNQYVGWGTYGRFTCDNLDGMQYAVYAGTYSGYGFKDYPKFVLFPSYVYDETSKKLLSLSKDDPSIKRAVLSAGYSYAWELLWNVLYSTAKGYVNVKWGGIHSLYALVESGKFVMTAINNEVVVDAATYTSLGYVLKEA